jgi:hypothetical protein
MFIIIIINGAKTISLQTSFEDLIIIRNGAKKKISLQTLFWGLDKKQSIHNMSPETSFGGHNKKRSKHNKI